MARHQTILTMTVALAISLVVLVSQAAGQSAADDLNRIGIAWAKEGNTEKAIEFFSEAISLDPKHATAFQNRGVAWSEMGNHDKAIADYSEAIRLNSKFVATYTNRGNSWRAKGNNDEAIADYSEAIRLSPKYVTAYNNRGLAWQAKGNYEKAISDYKHAININSKFAHAYNNIGNVWSEKGETDKAITEYSNAIMVDPGYALGYYNRGGSWYKKGDYKKAIADYSEAIRLNPKDEDAHYSRGLSWRKKGDYDRAIADYSEAIRLAPSFVNAQESLQLAVAEKQRISQVTAFSGRSAANTLSAGRRVALVIGNSSYKALTRLENPTRDAELVAGMLRDAGFNRVFVAHDLTRDEMMKKLKDFEQEAALADWGVIYYAGHGIEVSGVNYMVPIDAEMTEARRISNQTVNMEYFLNGVEAAHKFRLLIFDACRDNPFVDQLRVATSRGSGRVASGVSTSVGQGLSRVEPKPGTLIVYAAKHGEIALDGDGKNSPFAEALVKRIQQKPPIEVRRLFDFVRKDVYESTDKQQQPFAYGSLEPTEDFYFAVVDK